MSFLRGLSRPFHNSVRFFFSFQDWVTRTCWQAEKSSVMPLLLLLLPLHFSARKGFITRGPKWPCWHWCLLACLLVHKPLPLHGMAWHCLTCKGGFHRVVVGTRQIRQGQDLSHQFFTTMTHSSQFSFLSFLSGCLLFYRIYCLLYFYIFSNAVSF